MNRTKLLKFRDEMAQSVQSGARMGDDNHEDTFKMGFDLGAKMLQPEIKKLLAALKFYADEENRKAIVERLSLPTGQIHHITTKYEQDAGALARLAIERYENWEKT